MLLGVLDDDLVLANTSVYSHGVIGEGSEGRNEGSQDMEQAFLLEMVSANECCTQSVELGDFLRLGHGRPLRRRQWKK